MKIKSILYLIKANWDMFAKTKLKFPENEAFSIPRIYLFIPIFLYLGYESFFGGTVTRLGILFLTSACLFEMARIYNKCFLDPINLFHLNTNFKYKFLNIFIAEFFGVKFLSLSTFCILGLVLGIHRIMALSILFGMYSFFILISVTLSIIGNRIKLVSVFYQWALIILFSMLYSFSGVGFTADDHLPKIHLSFQNWMEANFIMVILFSILIFIALCLVGYLTSIRIYSHRPFINRDSFPRKMI